MLFQPSDIERLRETAAEQVADILSNCDIDGLYLVAEGFALGRLPSGEVEDGNLRLAMGLAVPTLLGEIRRRLATIEAN
jgi:hypothetical protein